MEDTTRLESDHCPNCKHILDSATPSGPESVVPGPGEITICFYCLSWLTFQENMKVRLMERQEIKAIPDTQYKDLAMATLNIYFYKDRENQ
jgi:hypothetical protein